VRRGREHGDGSARDIAGDVYECGDGDGDFRDRNERSDENCATDANRAVEPVCALRVAVAAEGEEGDVDVAEDGKEEGVMDADAVGESALSERNNSAADDGGDEQA
jgi:hypothetical protein